MSARRRLLLAMLTSLAGSLAGAAVDPAVPQAPRMAFVPPAAGTYELQRIQLCPDASLLDSSARRVRLAEYTSGKITLLTFFYTYCADPWGCPFAYRTLTGLRDRLIRDPRIADRVRFVSVSFDPTHDTPDALRRYGERFAEDARFEWDFLTARSMEELLPVLDGFGQDVSVATDERGRATRAINHMLKLFLIDRHGIVREIYSLAFVHPEVMLNDIRTLTMEEVASLASSR
jgi:protein SCO1